MADHFDIHQLVSVFSWVSILLGSFFVLVGALGLVRMPDMFTRMHAASITDTVGAGFLILGMIGQAGATLITVKLVFILLLIAITSPVASHALAQAALYKGLEPFLSDDRRERSLSAPPATASPGTATPGTAAPGTANNGNGEAAAPSASTADNGRARS